MSAPSSLDPLSFIAVQSSKKCSNPEAGFEGPEKRLQLGVRSTSGQSSALNVPLESWKEICNAIGAQIVDTLPGEEIMAHLLTESSLFVSKTSILLITCGTTTLLAGLGLIMNVLEHHALSVDSVVYSRKNFSFPLAQKPPHHTLADEYSTLKKTFPYGKPYTFGPVDGDHYFYFAWDDRTSKREARDMHVNLVMYDICPELSREFTSEEMAIKNEQTRALREKIGLNKLFEDEEINIQDISFNPCGYSLNATEERGTYYTMHVTPESHCSYASFETNHRVKTYGPLVARVLALFKPRRFTLLIRADDASALGCEAHVHGSIGVERDAYVGYNRTHHAVNHFMEGYNTYEVNYKADSNE